MILSIVLSVFSGISFLFYGVASFRSRRMKSEFERWGYLKHRFTIGTFQILGGLGLLLGLFLPVLLLISSLSLMLMMLVAILVRVGIKDELIKMLPATFYAIINGVILYISILNNF
jgi:uncharacterized membrane protein YphA (DoxX/SURF4 family)